MTSKNVQNQVHMLKSYLDCRKKNSSWYKLQKTKTYGKVLVLNSNFIQIKKNAEIISKLELLSSTLKTNKYSTTSHF